MDLNYELAFQVRSSECDLQGIVNNANYLNYLEHTRHEFLKSHNIHFATLHQQGIDLVVYEMNLKYKKSLLPDDKFIVTLRLEKISPVRLNFKQEILRITTDNTKESVLLADVLCTGVDRHSQRPIKVSKLFTADSF
jgi:acyl-CoA thioester hydrolase